MTTRGRIRRDIARRNSPFFGERNHWHRRHAVAFHVEISMHHALTPSTPQDPTMLTWPTITTRAQSGNPPPAHRVDKSDAEWRAQLTEEQYRVARQAGTERAFSSEMCSLFEPGKYACVCCNTVLFDSAEKFESGTGWPSFTQPVAPNVVSYHADTAYGMIRVETLCNVCDAHLGHVFPDGPRPSGLRYCMNAVALEKVGATAETT